MQKIPVGETIAYAYRFVAGNLGALFGILWLPLLLMLAAGLIFGIYNLSFLENPATSSLGMFFLVFMFFYAVLFLMMAMITHSVTEAALGLSDHTPTVYFSVGRPVMRMLGAMGICALIVGSVYIAALLPTMLFAAFIGAAAATAGGADAGASILFGLVFGVSFLIALSAVLYVAVRITFFMAPVVVAEKTLRPSRMWALGKDQFWRMFGIFLAVWAPGIILSIVMMAFVYDMETLAAFAQLPGETPEAHEARIMALQIDIARRPIEYWYVFQPLGFVMAFFTYSLAPAASAFAYRALTSYEGGEGQQTAQDA